MCSAKFSFLLHCLSLAPLTHSLINSLCISVCPVLCQGWKEYREHCPCSHEACCPAAAREVSQGVDTMREGSLEHSGSELRGWVDTLTGEWMRAFLEEVADYGSQSVERNNIVPMGKSCAAEAWRWERARLPVKGSDKLKTELREWVEWDSGQSGETCLGKEEERLRKGRTDGVLIS